MGEKNSRKEKLGKRQKDEEVEDGSKMSPARSFRSDQTEGTQLRYEDDISPTGLSPLMMSPFEADNR
ncbi:hypothetical protein RUM43_012367 [Polyplax serrata]|uniref:Uncharacterized protein n=1 Tax=Polyplax serrata TaxID=468196 RepID=A0AAN8NKK4_POLSC